ncbi:MAG: hypothetical protein N2C14_14555 [Planctomycetales bacterium]
MTDPVEIEQLVRAVLQRLGRAPASNTAPALVSPVSASSALVEEPPSNPNKLTWVEPVVSATDLLDRLHGVAVVVVSPAAVVTPAARDLLKERNVRLEISAAAAVSANGTCPLAIGIAATDFDPQGLLKSLRTEIGNVETVNADGLLDATDRLCDRAADGETRSLLLTGDPFAATCLANRRSGVRAARVVRLADVHEAIESVAANLLIVDPSRHGVFELKQIAREFQRGGPRPCPERLMNNLS